MSSAAKDMLMYIAIRLLMIAFVACGVVEFFGWY